ncbi:MAG: type VII toxin-antitoxin system HepT family RNase toxin [Candidatus Heimdallarchaeaceae archaeon]
MPINNSYIIEKLASSKKYLETLQGIQEIAKPEFLENFPIQLQAERLFEILTLIMLDICTHLVANSTELPPESYSDCMVTLARLNVITTSDSEKFVKIIKMRNIIVHQYGKVDLELLYTGIQMLDKDFRDFKEKVSKWLNSQKV